MSQPTTAEDIQAQLLRRIADGEVSALSELYDQTATPLFSVALRILADASEAEEVIQDVFVQIWERASTFDPLLGSAFHWALSITRHRAIDRLRSRQRRARLVEQLKETDTGDFSEVSTPETGALNAEGAAIMRVALNRLPADQHQAIEMAFFGGLSHNEIADTLKEPLGTVKARIRRGLLKLRESLAAYK